MQFVLILKGNPVIPSSFGLKFLVAILSIFFGSFFFVQSKSAFPKLHVVSHTDMETATEDRIALILFIY